MPQISLQIDIFGIIVFVLGALSSILSQTHNLRSKYENQIKLICLKLRGLLEEKIVQYMGIRQDTTLNDEDKIHQMESTLITINSLSNEYYDWSHILTNTNNKLRKTFIWGIVIIILSIFLFTSGQNESTQTLVAMLKLVVGSIIVFIMIMFSPMLYDAYIALPNKIDAKYQQVQDGAFRSWIPN